MTDLYLYQTVHVARGRARRVGEHAALLDAASRQWYGRPYHPDVRALTVRIEALAVAERYPSGVSCFIRIELPADGSERLVAGGVSLYDGPAYRSLRPAAVSLCYEVPFGEGPTSAHEAATQLARQAALRAGAGAAIRCDGDGLFHEAEGAPLFAVTGHTILEAPGAECVERTMARQAVEASGLTLRTEAFGRPDLKRLDELFFVDHRGITSLSSCDGMPLMALLAERIAATLK